MPLALIAIGILAVVVAMSGQQNAFATQLGKDFSGSGSFFYWIAAIAILAVLGKVANVPNASKLFIALIVVVYLLSNSSGGNSIFTQLTNALANFTPSQPASTGQVGAPAQAVAGASGAAATSSSTTSPLGGIGLNASVSPGGIGISAGTSFGPISIGGGFGL